MSVWGKSHGTMWGLVWGGVEIVTVDVPGLEWAVDASRLQWTLDTGQLHWALDADRPHWKTTNQ